MYRSLQILKTPFNFSALRACFPQQCYHETLILMCGFTSHFQQYYHFCATRILNFNEINKCHVKHKDLCSTNFN